MILEELDAYTGNIRITAFYPDVLIQMFEVEDTGTDYTDNGRCEKYVGMVGKIKEFSHVVDKHLGCASIYVKFADDYLMMVDDGCVEMTYDPVTPVKDLPKAPAVKPDVYTSLTTDEKEFADKVFLELLKINANEKDGNRQDNEGVFDDAITLSLYRTKQYDLLWRR